MQGGRDTPKTALCPALSLLLTQEEVSQEFLSNLGHKWLIKWVPSPCPRSLYGVAFPLLCTECRLRRKQCSLNKYCRDSTCRFIVQNRMIINWFLLVSHKSLQPGTEAFCGQNPNGSLHPQGVYPKAPVLPVNTMDCHLYEVNGPAYVIPTMDDCTGLLDLALLFSLFLPTCCFTGGVYACGRLLLLTLFRWDPWDMPEYGSEMTSRHLSAKTGRV